MRLSALGSVHTLALLGVSSGQDPYGNVTNALSVYEVGLPLPSYGSKCASQIVANQEFANSYGKPAYFSYNPPEDCEDFIHVTADLYIASYGYQYDRLMHVLKDGIEVWRPSTPEPVGHNITSLESKDLSTFVNLFKSDGLVQFSLDNILAGPNEGPFYAELRLNFYRDQVPGLVDDTNWFYKDAEPPTNFYPVIANESYIYQQPASGTAPKLSRNTTRVALSVFASGNSNEEFWWGNEYWDQDGAIRIVTVLVDGEAAGYFDPFPIVYTGGLNPGLWQPLMGLKASDVPSYIVDLTPFLPKLWDHETTIEIEVGNTIKGAQDIQSNWIISSALLTWESEGTVGSGSGPVIASVPHSDFRRLNSTPDAEAALAWVSHNYSSRSNLTFVNENSGTWSGQSIWTQYTMLYNQLNESNTDLNVHQHGRGLQQSVWQWQSNNDPDVVYERSHFYPLDVILEQTGNLYKEVSVNRSFDLNVTNNGIPFWEKIIQESTDYDGRYTSLTDVLSANYHRTARAVDGKVVEDTDSTQTN